MATRKKKTASPTYRRRRSAAAKAVKHAGAGRRTAAKRRAAAAASAAPATLPDLEVETTGGRRLSLASLKGRPVVIYFYPKDDTPGCTAEGCDIRDHYGEFERRGAVVLGVSRDSLASHERFKAKYGFPFDLVSDSDERLCRLFGVMREKSLYGRRYLGVERSTFLYGRDGRLVREWRGVKVAGHAEELLAALDQLPAS
jgi:peroxiredoxin Q/BCP